MFADFMDFFFLHSFTCKLFSFKFWFFLGCFFFGCPVLSLNKMVARGKARASRVRPAVTPRVEEQFSQFVSIVLDRLQAMKDHFAGSRKSAPQILPVVQTVVPPVFFFSLYRSQYLSATRSFGFVSSRGFRS